MDNGNAMHRKSKKPVSEVLRWLGNMWPGAGSELPGWREFQHPVNEATERGMLFSMARG